MFKWGHVEIKLNLLSGKQLQLSTVSTLVALNRIWAEHRKTRRAFWWIENGILRSKVYSHWSWLWNFSYNPFWPLLRLFRNIALLRQAGRRKQQLSSRIFTLGGEIIPVIFYGIRKDVKLAIAFKGFRLLILLEVERVQAWAVKLLTKYEKSSMAGKSLTTQFSHLRKHLMQSLSLITVC